MKYPLIKLAVLSSLLWMTGVHADWRLQGDESSVHFVSIKNDAVGEVHAFKQLEGKITKSGEFEFAIHVSAVETNIPIRNERMNEFLFKSTKFPLAVGKGTVNVAELNKLPVGQLNAMSVPVTIELHGKSVQKEVMFQVAKLNPEKIWAVTVVPFLIDAPEFELNEGVEKLRELAGLRSIGQAVPVSASLVFVSTSASKDQQ